MKTISDREYVVLQDRLDAGTLGAAEQEKAQRLLNDYVSVHGRQPMTTLGAKENARKIAGNLAASVLGLPGDLLSLVGLKNRYTSEALSEYLGGDVQHDSWLATQLFAPGPGEFMAMAGLGTGIIKGQKIVSASKVNDVRKLNMQRTAVAEGVRSAMRQPQTPAGLAMDATPMPVGGPPVARQGQFYNPYNAAVDSGRNAPPMQVPPGRTPAMDAGPSLMGPEQGTRNLKTEVMRVPHGGTYRQGKAGDVVRVTDDAITAVRVGELEGLLAARLQPWKAPLVGERSTAQAASRGSGTNVILKRDADGDPIVGQRGGFLLKDSPLAKTQVQGTRAGRQGSKDGVEGLPEEVMQARADSVVWPARFEEAPGSATRPLSLDEKIELELKRNIRGTVSARQALERKLGGSQDETFKKLAEDASRERRAAWTRMNPNEQESMSVRMVEDGDVGRLFYYFGDDLSRSVKSTFGGGQKATMDAEDALQYAWMKLAEGGAEQLRRLWRPGDPRSLKSALHNYLNSRALDWRRADKAERLMYMAPELRRQEKIGTVASDVAATERELTGGSIFPDQIERSAAHGDLPSAAGIKTEAAALEHDLLSAQPKAFTDANFGSLEEAGGFPASRNRTNVKNADRSEMPIAEDEAWAQAKGPVRAVDPRSPLDKLIDNPARALNVDDIDEFAGNAINRLGPEDEAFKPLLMEVYETMRARTWERTEIGGEYFDVYDIEKSVDRLPGGERVKSISHGVINDVAKQNGLGPAETKALRRRWQKVADDIDAQYGEFQSATREVEDKVIDMVFEGDQVRFKDTPVRSGLYGDASKQIQDGARSFREKEILRAHLKKLEKRLANAQSPAAREAIRKEGARTLRNLETVERRPGQSRVSRPSAHPSDYNTWDYHKSRRSSHGATIHGKRASQEEQWLDDIDLREYRWSSRQQKYVKR